MKANVIYSDKFLKGISWFMSIGGITLWPFIILREMYQKEWMDFKRTRIIRHESIHIAQQGELLVLPFYVLYILEWGVKLLIYGRRAYYNISFEREAYGHEDNKYYLQTRKPYSWVKYIFNDI